MATETRGRPASLKTVLLGALAVVAASLLVVVAASALSATTEAPVSSDVDCDGDVDAVDALKVLRHVAGLSVSQESGCPDIGSPVASIFGDVDCDGDVDAVDGLKVLRHVAGLSVSQEPGCPDIGGPASSIVETIEAPALLLPDEFAAATQSLAETVAKLNQAELRFIEDATGAAVAGVAAPGDMALSKTSVGVPLLGSNGKIAFHSTRDGNWEIYVMDADGANPTNRSGSPADEFNPAWSPDGSAIAFASTRDGNWEIYVMDADGANQARRTSHQANEWAPAWSPDGTRIAFVSNRDGNAEIYTMKVDGTGVTRLTNNDADDLEPAWSPDGTEIAFRSQRDGNWEIYVMDADGSGQVNLTNHLAADELPSWSPDGKIGFQSNRTGNYEIYVMDRDGSSPTNLTNNPANDWTPTWSPDGTRMAFNSDRDGNSEIYAMSSNGAGQARLTNNSQLDAWPRWSPTAIVTPPPTPGQLDEELREVAAQAMAVAQTAEVLGLTMVVQDGLSETAGQQADIYYGVARLGYALVIEVQNARDGLTEGSLTPSAAAEVIAEYGSRLWNPSVADAATSGNPFLSHVSNPSAIPPAQFLSPQAVGDFQSQLPTDADLESWLAASGDSAVRTLSVPHPTGAVGNSFDPDLLQTLVTPLGQADGDSARWAAAAHLSLLTAPLAEENVDGATQIEVPLFASAAMAGAAEVSAGLLPVFEDGVATALTSQPGAVSAGLSSAFEDGAATDQTKQSETALGSFRQRNAVYTTMVGTVALITGNTELLPVEEPDVRIEITGFLKTKVSVNPSRWEITLAVSRSGSYTDYDIMCVGRLNSFFGSAETIAVQISMSNPPSLTLGVGAAHIHCEAKDRTVPGRTLAVSQTVIVTLWDGPRDDLDGDGVPDAEDQCREQAEDRDGWEDDDGCPDWDNDGDGIIDHPTAFDDCPDQPEDEDGFLDGDGCPDPDNDADGVLDGDDVCPDDPDCDGDGVEDGADQCPDTPAGATVDESGCPLSGVVTAGASFVETVAGGPPVAFSTTASLTADFITMSVTGNLEGAGGFDDVVQCINANDPSDVWDEATVHWSGSYSTGFSGGMDESGNFSTDIAPVGTWGVTLKTPFDDPRCVDVLPPWGPWNQSVPISGSGIVWGTISPTGAGNINTAWDWGEALVSGGGPLE